MAKQLTTLPISHNDVPGFKQWVTELAAMLDFMGLAKTADTGQINIAAIAAVPAINVSAGYEIRALLDKPNFPLYFKIEYGTNGTTGRPQVWLTIGSSSDGAGNITGFIFQARLATGYSSWGINSTTSNYLTFACNTAASKWGYFKAGSLSNGNSPFYLFVIRNVDENENVLDDAVTLIYPASNTTTFINWWRTIGGFASTTLANNKPNNLGATIVNGGPQGWRAYLASPLWRPMVGMLWATNELSGYARFIAAPVKVNHTYIALPYLGGTQAPVANGYSYSYIWE